MLLTPKSKNKPEPTSLAMVEPTSAVWGNEIVVWLWAPRVAGLKSGRAEDAGNECTSASEDSQATRAMAGVVILVQTCTEAAGKEAMH